MSVALKFRGVHERDVTRDASIDEFAGQSDDSDDEGVNDACGADEMSVGERVSAAEPAPSTSRYEPDGVACAACDAEVVRLWVADDGAVCADCKSW